MGASPSHPLYVKPAAPPLDPVVARHLRFTGPVYDAVSPWMPLSVLRAVYDLGGVIDKPVLRRPVTEAEKPMVSADGSTSLSCRLYTPGHLGAAEVAPLCVFIHGGGYTIGSATSHQSTCRFIAAETGFRVLAAVYRRAPEAPYPAAQNDVFEIYRQISARPAEFGLDPARPRVVISGDSAGGQLTIALGLMIREHNRKAAATTTGAVGAGAGDAEPPAASAAPAPVIQSSMLVPFYPVINRYREWQSTHKYSAGYMLSEYLVKYFCESYLGATPEARDRFRTDALLNPDLQSDFSGMPPMLVVTAECDILHDEAVAFAATVNARGGAAVHVEAAGQVHGFVTHLMPFVAGAAVVRDACARMVAVVGAADDVAARAALRGEPVAGSVAPGATAAAGPAASGGAGAGTGASAASASASGPAAESDSGLRKRATATA